MEAIQFQQLPALFRQIGAVMQENEAYLCELDAEMGDGDLGLTMRKGFTALPAIIEELQAAEPALSKVLMKAGMKLASVVPSTMGTLMGSGIMSGAKAVGDVQALDGEALTRFYRGFAEGLQKRGKCQVGDRTVLDAVDAAAAAAERCPERTLIAVAEAAHRGAQDGLEATKTMLPKFGKAAVFSQKATGRVDQGAVVGVLLTQAIEAFCRS